jgi:iron-regulated transporter 1
MESQPFLADDPGLQHELPVLATGLPATTQDRLPLPPSPNPTAVERGIPSSITARLFISHFLSTWNSRVFEFGAVLFLAALYPGTLLPSSLYALLRGLSVVCLAPIIGRYVDHEDRLNAVRLSIVVQRAATAVSCGLFLVLVLKDDVGLTPRWTEVWGNWIFGALVILACVEKLCSVMNLIAVERDWVCSMLLHTNWTDEMLGNRHCRR